MAALTPLRTEMHVPASASLGCRIDMQAQLPGRPIVESESESDEEQGGPAASGGSSRALVGSTDESSDLAGVGLEFGSDVTDDLEIGAHTHVNAIDPSGAAAKSGLVMLRDTLCEVDGRDVSFLLPHQVKDLEMGPPGTSITLGLKRSSGHLFYARLIRAHVAPSSQDSDTSAGNCQMTVWHAPPQQQQHPTPHHIPPLNHPQQLDADANMLLLIDVALRDGPGAVVDAMLNSLPRGAVKNVFVDTTDLRP